MPQPFVHRLDRAIGAVLGSAVGDALGAGYEFAAQVAPNDVTMRPGTLTGMPAGWWTDDTAMAVGVLDALADGHDLRTAAGTTAVAQRFLDWYASNPTDVGMHTRRVLHGVSDPAQLLRVSEETTKLYPESAGNGSLMRTGPVALGFLRDLDAVATAARRVSSLTHHHELCQEACVLWSVAIASSIRSGVVVSPREGLTFLDSSRRAFWEERLDVAESTDPSAFSPNGFVVSAFQAAWSAVWHTRHERDHFSTGLRAVIAVGDDTDTTAAIAGALLGAAYGVSRIPWAWRRGLRGWPEAYSVADLVGKVALALRAGEDDAQGWPRVASLASYYDEEWQPAGRLVASPLDPGVTFGDVARLADAPSDAFVSLCRIGYAQRRGPDHEEVLLLDNAENLDAAAVLASAADMIATFRSEGKRVFVHCARAESRTPAVAMAWLQRHHGRTFEAAHREVRELMPWAEPNASFREALATLS